MLKQTKNNQKSTINTKYPAPDVDRQIEEEHSTLPLFGDSCKTVQHKIKLQNSFIKHLIALKPRYWQED